MPTLNASVILQLQYFKEPNFTVHNPVPTYAGSNRYTPRAAAIAGLLKTVLHVFLISFDLCSNSSSASIIRLPQGRVPIEGGRRAVLRSMTSINTIRDRKGPFRINDWMMDSGGFTELSTHGRWRTSPQQYADKSTDRKTMAISSPLSPRISCAVDQ
jgi:hypothetical protein